jgi:HAD superfamily hydrolase (TIGR01490 family)
MNKNAFFDVDHTLYDGYLGTNFNHFMVERGHASKRAADEEDRLTRDYRAGVIDYREAAGSSLQLTADCVSGKTVETIRKWQGEFIERHNYIFPWVASLIGILRERGFTIYLISAAPLPPLEAVAKLLDVEDYYGTEFEVVDDTYTGRLKTTLNYEEKHTLIQKLIGETKAGLHIGFGDSLGDVDMLSAMDKAFLYSPKSQELIDIANSRGWQIVDATTILSSAFD